MGYFIGENVPLGRYVIEKPKKLFENRNFKKLNVDYLGVRERETLY